MGYPERPEDSSFEVPRRNNRPDYYAGMEHSGRNPADLSWITFVRSLETVAMGKEDETADA